MATATITVTNAQLLAVLALATTDVVEFDLADVEPAAITAAAQAYVNLELSKSDTFEPFGRQLRRFANTQIPVLRAEVVDPG